MKRLFYLLAISLVVFTTSCKQEEEKPVDDSAFGTLTDYLVDNNMDTDAVIAGWITGRPATADEVPAFVASYNIIDIRSAEDFANGRLEGAVNSTLVNVLATADAFPSVKPILVVCYTGQTAGRAVVALRLSGYTDAKVLKFGMCGWTAALPKTDKWANAIGNAASTIGNWTAAPGDLAATESFDYPTLETSETTGSAILEDRVEAMLSNTAWFAPNTDVLTTPTNYFINNYWAATDVEHYGHVSGAYRISPLTIADDQIKNLDPSKTVVTYCWTGQTSSMMTAYLDVIGYSTKSLGYGVNGMIYDDLESHKFVTPTVDYPTVTE